MPQLFGLSCSYHHPDNNVHCSDEESFERIRGRYPGESDIESGNGFSPESRDMGMNGFFEKVGKIEKQIENITALYYKLQQRVSFFFSALKEQMEKDVEEVKLIALKLKKGLEELDRDITDTLAEIQERHDAVMELEQKLLDLQQMFLDMSVMVDAQGDILNDIETQVSNSIEHVQKATVTLKEAKKLQRNTRKWMCFAILILLVIIIMVLASVLKDFKKS
ncbi:hypothetical protein J5N97_023429 [Dioscorea zingiberensis]|uniref:t-SNARE coiled-coil homology domain-containing protein n=1 Tax=Dioscorea zingiberensis TaxID=325984 RepID=A0A9D5H7Z5_9LILI|nr:hypothetical protein J5N97_023429 [Dioscorea zingiberensis]